ncbi:putative Zn(II)2Cys6 transcription factor [Colletotrichum sp. SAR 10_86]|nr:putative Zn(II)2Cys6 transcription factor [Colletotrichum sp. SAR 10_76]KAI8235539.1 putative Zn(II)2Cys6 transcription factor [Colletotrichum sp. SAR 10_86]
MPPRTRSRFGCCVLAGPHAQGVADNDPLFQGSSDVTTPQQVVDETDGDGSEAPTGEITSSHVRCDEANNVLDESPVDDPTGDPHIATQTARLDDCEPLYHPSQHVTPPLMQYGRLAASTSHVEVSGAFIPPFSLGQAVSQNASPLPDPPPSVSDALRARLISYYLRETGTWCNTTDSEMHFTVKGIHQMMKSLAFSSAAMALASRQLDNAKGGSSQLTLNLYQDTIQFLLRHDPNVADPSILATCTPDVWAAFIMEQSTLIPTDSWVQDESVASVAAKNDLDDYCNLAILIFAKIVNVAGPMLQHATLSSPEVTPIVNDLWKELQAWLSYRPKDALPLVSAGPTRSNPFPTVVFATSSPSKKASH